MGMFNWVDYECVCPNCHSKVSGFQTKDGYLDLSTVPVHKTDSFCAHCDKCGCWIDLERIVNPTDKFRLTVEGKNGKTISSKVIKIKEQPQ